MKLVKESFGKFGTIGITYCNETEPIETFVEYESATDFKALKLYITLSSTSTTNCFASTFKQKLDICMMNYDDRLSRFNKTSTNWHLMSSMKKSCICGN